VFVEDLLGALRRALVGRFRTPLDNVCLAAATPHTVTRLADTVLRFIACPEDAPTFRLLGRQVGHAPGCLRNWCRTGDIQPRMFRDFARGLRAVYRIERHGDTVDADLLAIVDGRTLRQFRLKCGGSPSALPRTVATFLDSQQFVRQQVFIEAVRAASRRLMVPRHRRWCSVGASSTLRRPRSAWPTIGVKNSKVAR
jgi:hypothetical protein